MLNINHEGDVVDLERLMEPHVNEIGAIITNNNYLVTKVNDLAYEWTGLTEGDIVELKMVNSKFIKARGNIVLETRWIKEKTGARVCLLFLIEEVKELNKLNQIVHEYQSVLESFYDDILVADGEGIVLRAGRFNEQICGLKNEEIEGKSVYELEKKGIMVPSATVKVLKTKQRVTLLQITNLGRKLVVTSFPIFDQNGIIARVISFSKDITEEDLLAKRLREEQNYLKFYHQQHEILSRRTLDEFSMVGESSQIKNVEKIIIKAAAAPSNVLILGESGVGKELVARNIHRLSDRSEKPFVTINCGAIPENLLESELFGYGKGAFTGACSSGKSGQLELADKGTLFLDEIGDMPLNLQVKLLDVIQNKRYKRIGEVVDRYLDIRVIAPTHRNLISMVKAERFRLDLYYRLNVLSINVPPLRKRGRDVNILCDFFLNRYCTIYGKNIRFSETAIEILNQYSWPGNVRELENVIEGLVVMLDNDSVVEDRALKEVLNDDDIFGENDEKKGIKVNQLMPLKEAMEDMEDQLFTMAMKEFKTVQASAEFLGVHQSTLSRKLQKLSRNKK